MTNALVLSGGGAKGSFEVGAVQYLYSQGFSPDIIAGTSVGSVNAVKLAEGEDSSNPTRGLSGLLKIWLDLKGEQDMYVEVDALQQLGINLDLALKTFNLRDGGMISASVSAIQTSVANSIFWAGPIGSIVTGILLSNVQTDLNEWFSMIDAAQALYTLSPLEARAQSDQNVLNLNFLQDSPTRLFLATLSLDTGRLLYVDKFGQVFDSENLKKPMGTTDVVTAVFASAAAPLFFTPRSILSQTCVDGGVRALIPVKVAVDAGADTIYAVDCNVPVQRSTATTLMEIAFRSLDIMVEQVGIGNLALCAPGGTMPRVFLVRPSLEVHGALTVDPGLIRINIGYGFMRAYDDLELKLTVQGRNYARVLSDDISKVRVDIFAKELALIPLNPKDTIETVRRMKCQLLWLLQRRHDVFGSSSLPSDYLQWPLTWTEPGVAAHVKGVATPWNEYKVAGAGKGGGTPHVVWKKEKPCSVGIPLDKGMVPPSHMQLHALPEAFFDIRSSSSGYFIQSTFGRQGNFELVLTQGERLIHYYRNNDDSHAPWLLGGIAMQESQAKLPRQLSLPVSIQAATLIQSSYRSPDKKGEFAPGNLGVVARVSSPMITDSTDSLRYAARDSVTLQWTNSVPIKVANNVIDGVTGNPALLQSRFGGQGNFELVVPQGERLVHYWRNNDDAKHPWLKGADIIDSIKTPSQKGNATYSPLRLPNWPIGTAIIQSNFGSPGDFSLIVRMRPRMLKADGDYLDYFRFDSGKKVWLGPYPVACGGKQITGVTGNPALIQSGWGRRGNFELIVPQGSRLVHYFRDNDSLNADDPHALWVEVADLMSLPNQTSASEGSWLLLSPVQMQLAAEPISVSLIQSTLGRWGSMCALVWMRPLLQGWQDYLVLYQYEPNMECSSSAAFVPSSLHWHGPLPVKLPPNISDPLTGSP